jgi:hypothetical protein
MRKSSLLSNSSNAAAIALAAARVIALRASGRLMVIVWTPSLMSIRTSVVIVFVLIELKKGVLYGH